MYNIEPCVLLTNLLQTQFRPNIVHAYNKFTVIHGLRISDAIL